MKAIAAMDINRGIGFHGKLPWPPIKEDFQFFKQKTMETGKLIMGNETFKSVGPLKGRFTYVLTKDPNLLALPMGAFYQYVSLEMLKDLPTNDMWLCGGVKAYTLLLPYCTEVYVTHVLEEYEGDAYMPYFEDNFPNQEVIQETKDFWIVKYSKSFITKPSISPELNGGRADYLSGEPLPNE